MAFICVSHLEAENRYLLNYFVVEEKMVSFINVMALEMGNPGGDKSIIVIKH